MIILRSFVEDNLDLVIDKEFKKNLSNNEEIIFSDNIIKYKIKVEQERIFVITNLNIFNCLTKKNKIKGKISISNLLGLTVSEKNNTDFIIHSKDLQYDYHLKSENRRKIIQIITMVYFNIKGKKLPFSLIQDKNIQNYVTLKSERKKNECRMDTKCLIDVDIFLYGNFKKTKGKKQINSGIFSVASAQKTEIFFFEESFTDNTKIKIDNFKIIKTLKESLIGKIYLSNFLINNTICIMKVINTSKIDKIIDFDNFLEFQFSGIKFFPKVKFIFKTKENSFFVYNFSPDFEGGFLFYHLKINKIFNEEKTKFYITQIAMIIKIFQEKKIYMNFKPENFILDNKGYIKYFGYEINNNNLKDLKIYNCKNIFKLKKDDWFNLGVFMYLFLFGICPSFNKENKIKFPRIIKISDEAKNFMKKIFNNEIKNFEDFKNDIYFKDMDFKGIEEQNLEKNILPNEMINNLMKNNNNFNHNENEEDEENIEDKINLLNYEEEL